MNKNEHENIAESFRSAGFTESEINLALSGAARMRAEEQSFAEYFSQNWSRAYIVSECFYVMINKAAESCARYFESLSDYEKNEKPNTFTALTRLHKRASQQYLEIITLVKAGFADGAFARWRSMHELSVISSFILKYGEPVAEKFIEASETEDRYDWAMASNAFRENKRHVTFGDILKLCDLDVDVWKEDYTVANQTVHASPQGTFGRLGAQDNGDSLRSGYGIAAPAIQCANTLALVSSMLFSLYPDEETVEKMSLAAKLLDALTEIYYNTHERLFPE